MIQIRISLLVLLILLVQSIAQDIRFLTMSIMTGWQLQCASTTCLSIVNVTVLDIDICQITCLAENQCQAATFDRSISSCKIFTNIQNETNNLLAHVESTTMFVITGTRAPLEVELTTISTSTSTSATMTTSSTTTSTTTAIDPCAFRWNTTGVIVAGTAGTGSGIDQLSGPFGIYIVNNTLYVADFTNSRIQKVILTTGVASTIAGTGTSGNSNTQFDGPEFVFVDGNQNLYVPDYFNNRVQKFLAGSSIGTTIAGTGTAGSSTSQLNGVRNVWLDSSNQYLYQVDATNQRVMKFSTNSTTGTAGIIVAGGNGGGNSNNQLNGPWGIYYDTPTTTMYIVNYDGHSIMKWVVGSSNGSFILGTPGVSGSNSTLFNNPIDVRVDKYNNIYVVEYNNHRVQMFCSANGRQGTTIAGGNGQGNSNIQLNLPRSIDFDTQMNLYVSEYGNSRVKKFAALNYV